MFVFVTAFCLDQAGITLPEVQNIMTRKSIMYLVDLTLILLTWTIWRGPTNASKWRMGFNSAFKGLIVKKKYERMEIGSFLTLFPACCIILH
jgi:hypothetical protein